jgi:hypothetical protein
MISGNIYTLQLSNSDGSFSNPTEIGSFPGTASSGTIEGTIAPGTAAGNGYRVRILSSNPSFTSSDNGSNISVNPIPSASISAYTDINCFGGSNGSVTVNASDGTPGYTYLWNTTATSPNISGVPADTYSVTVTDSKGCLATATKTLAQPSAPVTGSVVIFPASCFGTANGAIDLTPSGGTSPYTYNWGNSPTQDRVGLVAGTYNVTITDNLGCTSTLTEIIVGQPGAAVSGTRSSLYVNCFGGTNGSIDLTPSGGVGGYTYNWGGGITTEDRTGLAAGTYSVIITDANGCSGTVSNILVGGPSAPLTATFVTGVACSGNSTGSINLTPSGGIPNYYFNWSDGVHTEDRTGLAPGTYSVLITDGADCHLAMSGIVVSPSAIQVSGTTVVTDVACFAGTTGSIDLIPSGGSSYSFNWGNGITTEDRTSVPAGIYSVTITDVSGCSGTVDNIIVGQPSAALSGTTVVTPVSCFGGANGTIDLTPAGGTAPYTFTWTGGITTEDRTGLTGATYSVVIRDAKNCTRTVSNIVVSKPSSALSATTIITPVSCFGGTNGGITLTPAGGTSPYTYNWGGGISTKNRANIGAGTYSVIITDARGCTFNYTGISVTQPTALVLTAVSNQAVCAAHTTSSVALSGNATTYTWTNDNTGIGLAASGTGNIASFLATNNGNSPAIATITVTPANASCQGAPVSFTITVNPTPSASISYIASPYSAGPGTAAVTLTGTSGGMFSGSAGLIINPATGAIDLANSTYGTHTVTYSLTPAGGCEQFSTTATVQIVNPFSATIAYTGSPYCSTTGTAVITRIGTGGGTYTASPFGLTIDASTGDINLAASASGSYTVRYGVSANDFTVTQVTVRPAIAINAVSNAVYCAGAINPTVTFTGAPGLSFSWTASGTATGISSSGFATIPAFTTTNSGITTIQDVVTVSANGGTGCSSFKPMSFRITVKPVPVLIPVRSQTVCAGTASAGISFASSIPLTTTSWSNNNGLIGLGTAGTGNIPSFTIANNTGSQQTATITATPVAAGCAGTPILFTITSSLSVQSISYAQASYCQNGYAFASRVGSAGGSYSATPAGLLMDANTGQINLALSQPGTYTVTYTVTASGGCAGTASTQLQVLPQASVSPLPNQTFCNGIVTPTMAFTGTAAAYNWTNDNAGIGLAASGSGTSLPSFTTTNAGPGTLYATIRVSPQGNNSTQCPGRTMAFRIAVSYCGPIAHHEETSGDNGSSRMSAAMTISPNPASAKVMISVTESGSYLLQVIDRMGTPVSMARSFTGNGTQLDISNLLPGSYVIRITNKRTGQVHQRQVVKL